MKKISVFIFGLLIAISLFSFSSYAIGEVVGDVYATDVVTYIYDAPITSYNIGGKTLIDAEILNWHYGFDVYWLEDERKLTIDDKGARFISGQAASGEIVEKYDKNPGEVIGKYYNTDIVAFLNGKEITSYNIGGRTVILAEEMAEFGYDVLWNENSRILKINKPNDFYKYETPYGTIKSIRNYNSHINFAIKCKANVSLIKDQNEHGVEIIEKNVTALTDGASNQFICFSDFAEIFEGVWSVEEGTLTHNDTSADGEITIWDEYIYELKFLYDNTKEIKTVPLNEAASLGEWPNKDGKIDVVTLENIPSVTINDKKVSVRNQYAGKFFSSYPVICDGEMYIPVQIVAELMGYDISGLNIVSYSVDK